MCQFFGGHMTRTFKFVLACFSLFMSVGLSAAPATRLDSIEILRVTSVTGADEEVGSNTRTVREHHGSDVRVYVLERGYGNPQPNVTFNGQRLRGESAPVCNQAEGLVVCNGAGSTVGYLHTFTFSNTDGGRFEFSNVSLVPPHDRLSASLDIR